MYNLTGNREQGTGNREQGTMMIVPLIHQIYLLAMHIEVVLKEDWIMQFQD
jgi:hypothetical protein